jgi:hypothetical protein
MEKIKTITIRQYLTRKNIPFVENHSELLVKCIFNGCDKDSKNGEYHLAFKASTGQYHCFKCDATGNILTLARFLGDDPRSVIIKEANPRIGRTRTQISEKLVESCHNALTSRIRKYLHNRGITDEVIDACKIGYGSFYKKSWITIPIKDLDGKYKFFKLRQDPDEGDKKMTFPGGEAQLYDWDTLRNATEKIVICEGELDRLVLLSKGVKSITSTAGAMTFKEPWLKYFPKDLAIYICFDNDDTGRNGVRDVANMFKEAGYSRIYKIELPKEVGEKGDITDYFSKLKGTVDDFFSKHAVQSHKKIDYNKFKPLSSSDLAEVLGISIKQDNTNKVVTFMCELSAYTQDNQFNISYNAPSSTGKSYIPTEIARLFPPQDVIETGYCSPTAFFHDTGEYDEEKKCYTVDLSRKIIIFLDQPHFQLLERLRPVLSHDKKEIQVKITDKTYKHGMKTKTIMVKGYPSVIFCTAGLKIDDQEATRFLLLSPEISQEKIRRAILQTIKKETDSDTYNTLLEENMPRKLLKERIEAIKQEQIQEIKLESPTEINEIFLKRYKTLKPRHQRDIKRVIALIKSFALLNLWWRKREGVTITANNDDIKEAFKVWDEIFLSQEFNLPPYVYNLYNDIILPCWNDKNIDRDSKVRPGGVTRQEVLDYHFGIYGRMLDTSLLRLQILPMLEIAGLIVQEPDPTDRRLKLIYPAVRNNESSIKI